MEKYESICTVGEGSYGVVLKCKDKTNGSIVAIKKFLETENDKAVKKIATREIKILKTLRHENLVNLIEVFRRSRRIYLVFEFIEQNLLEEIERSKVGLGEAKTKEIMYQVVRGVDFMHSNNIIHRDIKPENVLINKNGLVKLCDFGFARHIAQPTEMHTDYVATRWYRSPELLVGDTKYGKPVDVWSIGVLTYEVLTSRPLFPGESDLDQLFLIMNSLGDITESMKICFQNNQFYLNVKLPRIKNFVPLQNRLRRHSSPSLTKFIMDCLIIDPQKRLTTVQLLEHELFTNSHWIEDFLIKLRKLVSMHETSIYRSSLHHTRVTRQSQQQQQQPQNRTHQQAAEAAAHSLPSDNTPSSLTIDASAIGPTTVGYNGNGKATTNKASSESLNQSDMSTTVTLPGPGQSHQPNQNHYHTNANNNVNHHHPMMNKVNITFSNLNTESKASFTSNITNESNNLMMKKNNPKMISDSLGVVKQSQQYPTKESSYGQEVNVNKNKNFLPKIERKTPESPKLDLQTNSLKTMNQQSNHVYKSQHLQQQQQQQQQQSMQMNNGPSKLNYVSFGNNNPNTMNNHHNNPHHNYPSNTHYQQPQQQQQQNQSNKKISSNSVDFNSISTNTNNNQHHNNNNNIIDNNLNLNTSSTATLTGIIAGSESMQQFASNSNTINQNNQPSSIQYNHPLMNRSNTNNTIHTPTNLDGGGGGGVYIIDENYRLNNNSTNGNGNSVKKQQPSNNHMNHMNHHHTNGSNPDVFSPSNNNPLASNASNSSSKSQHNKEVKFNTSTNVNSLRLPQVKPIEMYTKTNKNFLYENKKAVLMQINNKK